LEFVVGRFVADIDDDQEETSDPDRKTDDVDQRKQFLFPDVPECHFY
jgi:hypothetical protein